MSVNQYIEAFTSYLRSGDASEMGRFCENSEHIKRLAVYRNGFYKGCVDALAANFPMSQKRVGSENFRKIARLYVDHFPPEQGTLVGYGQDFPGFIADFIADIALEKTAVKTVTFKPDTNQQEAADLPLNLADIAHLDYVWLTSLMSADSGEILTPEYVTKLMEQGFELTELCVKLNASVLLFRVSEESFSEWIALKTNNNEAPKTESSAVDFVMLWRLQGYLLARSLSIAEVALMQALQALQGKGKPLGEAFDAAIAVNPNFEVSDAFAACLQNELLEIEMI
tara:strand:- start:14708 stop:15556 length:849 start_codon:yes stop_codon:yes gene_type:complete